MCGSGRQGGLTAFAGTDIIRVKREFAGNRTRFLYSPWLLALLVSRVFFVGSSEKAAFPFAGRRPFPFHDARESTRPERECFCREFSVVLRFWLLFFFFLVDEVGESVAAQSAHQLALDLMPGTMDWAEDVPLAGAFPGQALIDVERSLLGLHYIEQGDLLGRLEQVEAAADPALGTDDAGLDQGLKYLGKKSRSDVLGPADVLFEDDFSAWLFGQEEYCAYCIFSGAGNDQGLPPIDDLWGNW